jgi:proline racemase
LAADGKLEPGQSWIQEGILGTSFEGHFQWSDSAKERIRPTIKGRAFVTAQGRLLLDSEDPFCWGIGGTAPAGMNKST